MAAALGGRLGGNASCKLPVVAAVSIGNDASLGGCKVSISSEASLGGCKLPVVAAVSIGNDASLGGCKVSIGSDASLGGCKRGRCLGGVVLVAANVAANCLGGKVARSSHWPEPADKLGASCAESTGSALGHRTASALEDANIFVIIGAYCTSCTALKTVSQRLRVESHQKLGQHDQVIAMSMQQSK